MKTVAEVLKFLESVERGEIEKRVVNHDFNDHFLAMRGCEQHPVYHAEGDVLVHTDMVVCEARKLTQDVPGFADILMLTALCHDIGKPIVTEFNEKKGHWTAYNHGQVGMQPAAEYLNSLGAAPADIAAITTLIDRHLDPFQFVKNGTKAKGYRRLRKELDAVAIPVEVLATLAKADHFGRIADDMGNTEETIAEFVRAYKTYEEDDQND